MTNPVENNANNNAERVENASAQDQIPRNDSPLILAPLLPIEDPTQRVVEVTLPPVNTTQEIFVLAEMVLRKPTEARLIAALEELRAAEQNPNPADTPRIQEIIRITINHVDNQLRRVRAQAELENAQAIAH